MQALAPSKLPAPKSFEVLSHTIRIVDSQSLTRWAPIGLDFDRRKKMRRRWGGCGGTIAQARRCSIARRRRCSNSTTHRHDPQARPATLAVCSAEVFPGGFSLNTLKTKARAVFSRRPAEAVFHQTKPPDLAPSTLLGVPPNRDKTPLPPTPPALPLLRYVNGISKLWDPNQKKERRREGGKAAARAITSSKRQTVAWDSSRDSNAHSHWEKRARGYPKPYFIRPSPWTWSAMSTLLGAPPNRKKTPLPPTPPALPLLRYVNDVSKLWARNQKRGSGMFGKWGDDLNGTLCKNGHGHDSYLGLTYLREHPD